MDPDQNEEDMEYVKLDDERECHWGKGFEENYVGVDDQKVIVHDKRWDVQMKKKEALIKGGCSVEVSVSNGKKFLWIVVDYCGLDEVRDSDEIGLQGFCFNFFDTDEDMVVIEELRDCHYLLMLMKLWPGYCTNKWERINMKVE